MLCVSLITLCLSSHFVSALHLYISNCKCTVYIGQPTSPLDSHISFGVCHYVVSWLFDSVKLSARKGEYYERYKNIGVSRRSKIVRTVRSTCLALVLSCVTKMSIFFFIVAHLRKSCLTSCASTLTIKHRKYTFDNRQLRQLLDNL